MRLGRGHVLAVVAVTLTAGCLRTSTPVAPASAFLPTASIREIMDAEVDPAADAIWGSVGITITVAGENRHQPRTDEEWQAVRRSAVTLVESTNLLVMEGRHIAPANSKLAPGEPDPAVLQRRLDANRALFIAFAQALRGAGLKALAAIDAQDANRLLEVGGEIDEACEACHSVYWYPPDLVKN